MPQPRLSILPDNMVLIPGGTNAGTDPDFGAYSLTVDSFYMDRYEVTKALWDEVKNWNGGNGYIYDNVGSGKAPNHPVQTVSWYDVVKWCNARSEKDGLTPVYYTDAGFTQVYKAGQVLEPYVKTVANGYRLPTEVQWEFAARGGVSGRRFPWGNYISWSHANYYGMSSYFNYDLSGGTGSFHPAYATGEFLYTSPVGGFAPNGYGLFDMTGNVWEWCCDWYPGEVGPLGPYRVVRGGSWSAYGSYVCRIGIRVDYYPFTTSFDIGFRTVLAPDQ
jgi:sulfatase modifying factor 1